MSVGRDHPIRIARLLRILGIAGGLVMAAGAARAQEAGLRLPRIFGEGMVMQRGSPVSVWGWAAPGASVRVSVAGRAASAAADDEGRWKAALPAMSAGGPHVLTVTAGADRVVLRDVLVGDVWVASGQSNMEWHVDQANDAAREIAASADARLRHFTVPNSWDERPQDDVTGGRWETASPSTVGHFSAVAYFFARDLRRELGVPIGIIHTSWSGSNIETWMSRAAQGYTDASFAAVMAGERARVDSVRASLQARLGSLPEVDGGMVDGRPAWAAPGLDDADWAEIAVPRLWEEQGYVGMDGVAWYRTAFTLTEAEARGGITLGLGMIDDNDASWVNGVEIGRTVGYSRRRVYSVPASALHAGRNVLVVRVEDGAGGGGIYGSPETVYLEAGGARRPLEARWRFRVGRVTLGQDGQRINKIPTVLYNRMIYPLLQLPIRGVIWYQGESNANNDAQARAYRAQLAGLISSWRHEWTGAPGGFAFLWAQLPNFGAPDSVPPASAGWALLRESQAAALHLPRTGQAVTIDVGEAGDLHPPNKQDVGRRLALVAREKVHSQRIESSGPTYRRHTIDGNRVTIELDHAEGGLQVRPPGAPVAGFAIAGADRRWVWAQARVEGSRVVVWSDAVPNPVAVRYAWSNSPVGLVLYNREGLPAAPFRTDDW
jgi:sialate O-acetylesterase